MRSADIEAVVEANPNAELAVAPTSDAVKFVRIRGLVNHGGGMWRAKEATNIDTDRWGPAPTSKRYNARQICSVEDAQRKVDERIAANKAARAERDAIRSIVDRLRALGLPVLQLGSRFVSSFDADLNELAATVERLEKGASEPPQLSDEQLDAMLSAALGQIDYDVWKDFFALPDCGYAEDPEALRAELRSTRSAMREALAEHNPSKKKRR